MARKTKDEEYKQDNRTLLEKFKGTTEEEIKATKTAFILMFPCFIIAAIAAYYAPLIASFIVICLAVYQFIMSKQFIADYYKRS